MIRLPSFVAVSAAARTASHLGLTFRPGATTLELSDRYLDDAPGAEPTYTAPTFDVSDVGTVVHRAAADALYLGGTKAGRRVAGNIAGASIAAAS